MAEPVREVRWSARRKADAVMRLLRGEDLEQLSRELRVEAHRLAAWRDDFMAGGTEGLKAQPTTPEDRRLKEAERQDRPAHHGERDPAGGGANKGASDPAQEAAEVSAELAVALATVCKLTDAPRSTVYARRSAEQASTVVRKRGPKTALSDEELTEKIKEVIRTTPFSGEGHRKVTARLRREHGIRVGRKRVLRLMRQAGLLAPQRARGRGKPRPHDGTIIPPAPNMLWGTDATMAYTVRDGWVWAFVAIDHHTDEAWASVARRGDRFAALEPIYSAVRDRFGIVEADAARGVAMRHDWGPQYTSGHFTGALAWLGIDDSPAYVGEPPCNGCAERFIRTMKEQCIWARLYTDVDELREAVAQFIERYNDQWLIERHGHRTPREVYAAWLEAKEAA